MKKRIFRLILMIAGVLTVIVILFSQSFYQPQSNGQPKAKTEQKAGEHHEDKGAVNVNIPADVVPSPAIQLADIIPTVLKAVVSEPEQGNTFFPDIEITPYFTILLGAVISPNAP